MATAKIESPGESYLTGHSCNYCQQIVFPGTQEEFLLFDDNHQSWDYAAHFRLGVSLANMKTWLDCTFAQHFLRATASQMGLFERPDSIQLYAEMRLIPNTVSLVWLEDISSNELVDSRRSQKKWIMDTWVPFPVATVKVSPSVRLASLFEE